MDVSTAAPMVATMVGLGVGIDYALLLVTRHVEYLRARARRSPRPPGAPSPPPAARWSSPPATVLVSLMGLRLSGLPVYASFGFATAIAVVAVMAAALTLVPALCRLAGRRLLPRKVRGLPVEAAIERTERPTADRALGRQGRPHARCPGRSAPRS